MLKAVARYAGSFAALFATYWLYALIVVPFIEPQATVMPTVVGRETRSARTTARLNDLTALFGPDAWELSSPKVLETEQGRLLFKDYKPLPGGQMEVKPFTLILQPQEEGDQRTLVMQAPQGAVLNFDGDLNLSRGEIGKLVGGRLLGDIHIFSPESKPGAGDRLEVNTKHVQLTQSRVWTVHPVDFRMGKSYGSGRDLTIVLQPKPRKRGSSDDRAPQVGSLKSLSLVQVHKFVLDSNSASLLPGDEEKKKDDKEGGPLEITCEGPFQFDFLTNSAWFKRNVDVFKHYVDGASDSLSCQYLLIEFLSGEKTDDTTDDKADDDTSPLKSDLKVKRIVAVGQPVKMEAPSRDASARGEYLEFTVAKNRIHLAGDEQVSLRQGKQWLFARQVEYELRESNSLGPMWAEGPGKIVGHAPVSEDGKKDEKPFEVHWRKSLRIEPAENDQFLLSLDDAASFELAEMGQFSAQQLYVWFYEIDGPTPDSDKQMQVDRLVALNNVQIDSPRMAGSADRLEAFFRREDIQRTPPPAAGAQPPVAGAQPPVGQAGGGARRFPGVQPAEPEKTLSRFHVSGELVRVQALQRGKEMFVENITISGNARVKETQTEKPNETPLVVTGNTLEVKNANSPDAFLQVIGEPASVSARGMVAKGGNIQLDRARNQLWINGAGRMTIPLVKPNSEPRAGETGPLGLGDTPPWVTVSWSQRMDFDGQVARFLQDVRAETTTQYSTTGQLEVAFDQRVDFANPKQAEKAKARRLTFQNGVFLENRTLLNGAVDAIDQMQSKSLLIDELTGEMHAEGPGWVSSVRYGGVQELGAPGAAPVRPVSTAPRPRQLTYLKVAYQREIIGNIHKREVEFFGRVKTVQGPIKRWDDVLVIDRPETFGEQGLQVTCDQMSLVERGPQITPKRKAIELLARGNVFVERSTLTARADRLSYTEAKDLIILRGNGRTDAEITRQERIGAEWSHASAGAIYFWRSLNQIRVDDAEELDLTNFGSFSPRR